MANVPTGKLKVIKSPMPVFNPDAWLFPPANKIPLKWTIASRAVLAAIGTASKFWIQWVNKAQVHNEHQLTAAVQERPAERGLVTYCNHTACVDDPLMWGVLKMSCLLRGKCMRWTPTAEDVCFTNNVMSWFFSMGQCVPVRRGCGVYQKSMDFLVDKLNMGDWVHVFPEGRVNVESDKLIRFKWGIGRLIAECKLSPIVLPIVHLGMDDILPNKRPYYPQIGQKVTMLVGDPMDFAKDIEALKSLKKTPREIRKHITDKLQDELTILRERAIAIHSEYTNR